MRVALVVPGGVDRSGEYRVIPALVALVKELASRGEVHVFAFHQEAAPGEWLLHGAHVHNIGEGFTRLRCVRKVMREHSAKPFDVVHAVFSGSCGLVAVVAAWIAGTPSVVHVAGVELVALRDIDYGGAQRLLSRLRERWVLRQATVVTAASAPMLAQIQAFGVSALRVPLGVDLNAWPCRAPAPRHPGEPARLIHVASLNRVKDQPTLLRAMAVLAASGVDFHLDVIGEDTLGGAIQSLARELGLVSRITFHGFLNQRKVHALMTRAHIHLVSSRHEAGPVVALEAAAAGVPTVGTAVGHIAEWAPDAAVSVPVGDSTQLAAGVMLLLSDDERRLRLANEAYRRAIAQDAKYTADLFGRLYVSDKAARTE